MEKDNVLERTDNSLGMPRTETGLRYCLNSAALDLKRDTASPKKD